MKRGLIAWWVRSSPMQLHTLGAVYGNLNYLCAGKWFCGGFRIFKPRGNAGRWVFSRGPIVIDGKGNGDVFRSTKAAVEGEYQVALKLAELCRFRLLVGRLCRWRQLKLHPKPLALQWIYDGSLNQKLGKNVSSYDMSLPFGM